MQILLHISSAVFFFLHVVLFMFTYRLNRSFDPWHTLRRRLAGGIWSYHPVGSYKCFQWQKELVLWVSMILSRIMTRRSQTMLWALCCSFGQIPVFLWCPCVVFIYKLLRDLPCLFHGMSSFFHSLHYRTCFYQFCGSYSCKFIMWWPLQCTNEMMFI